MEIIRFDATCGTVSFWRSVAPYYRVRTWKSAMERFASQHGRAVAMMGDDSARIVEANGAVRFIPKEGVRWESRP